jgi:hypothetical protein
MFLKGNRTLHHPQGTTVRILYPQSNVDLTVTCLPAARRDKGPLSEAPSCSPSGATKYYWLVSRPTAKVFAVPQRSSPLPSHETPRCLPGQASIICLDVRPCPTASRSKRRLPNADSTSLEHGGFFEFTFDVTCWEPGGAPFNRYDHAVAHPNRLVFRSDSLIPRVSGQPRRGS